MDRENVKFVPDSFQLIAAGRREPEHWGMTEQEAREQQEQKAWHTILTWVGVVAVLVVLYMGWKLCIVGC